VGAVSPTVQASRESSAKRTVIVLSLDGFRHDYPSLASTPAFDRMEREGARVLHLIPPFPSQTFPSHATLATGVAPDKHGILNNRFVDRKRGLYEHTDDVTWYQRPPLWIHAQREGIRSYVYHWIAGAGRYENTEAALVLPFDSDVDDDVRISTISSWIRKPGSERPGLIFAYFDGCDSVGHRNGPDSSSVRECIARVDQRLARLLEAVDSLPETATTLLIVSDHGMTSTKGRMNPEVPFRDSDTDAQIVSTGPVAHVYLAEPTSIEEALKVAARIPHTKAWRGDELPAELHYNNASRTGDLVLVSEFGYHFDQEQLELYEDRSRGGHHGHDARDEPQMAAVFFAWGSGIRTGATLKTASSADVVPTVCRLLGIDPPADLDGRVLHELLSAGPGKAE